MLGDLRSNSNAGKSNKLYENTYYSRISMKGSDGLRLGFSFKSGMLVVDISQEKDGFQFETLSSCFLTPTKALLMFNQIETFKAALENNTYKDGTGYGVNTGIGDISTVLLVHKVDGCSAVTIGKVNAEGNYVSKFTYKFNKGYHYGISLSDYNSMSTCQKDIYDDIELAQFTQTIKSFADNMNGSIAYSTIDLGRYDYRGLMNKMNPIYDKLGIERGSNRSAQSDNNYFNGNNGGFNRGTSSNTTLDDIMDDLPTED